MTNERYNELMNITEARVSDEEFNQGWHFCEDWDFILIGPGMYEMECCTCKVNRKLHKEVYEPEEVSYSHISF